MPCCGIHRPCGAWPNRAPASTTGVAVVPRAESSDGPGNGVVIGTIKMPPGAGARRPSDLGERFVRPRSARGGAESPRSRAGRWSSDLPLVRRGPCSDVRRTRPWSSTCRSSSAASRPDGLDDRLGGRGCESCGRWGACPSSTRTTRTPMTLRPWASSPPGPACRCRPGCQPLASRAPPRRRSARRRRPGSGRASRGGHPPAARDGAVDASRGARRGCPGSAS